MKTAVVIADTLPMQMEDLAAGRTHGQVGQQPYMMGYKAMYVLKDIVDGKALKYDNTSNNAIYTGLDVCMKPNIATCIAG
jgi:ribose transport system substrate-binding protein